MTTTQTPVRAGSGAMFDGIARRYDLLNPHHLARNRSELA